MKSSALVSVVLAALVALAAAPVASAKLPPGTTFEACGASGCRTASGDEGLRLQLKLIEPTMESGAAIPPSGTHAWVRVDLDLGSASGGNFRSLKRRFPVVFASDVGYLGVPREDDAYRWVSLRASQFDAYGQLGGGVRPFSPATLVELDPVTVAQAKPTAPAVTGAGGGESDTTPTWLIALLAAAGPLVGLGLAARARRVGRRVHRPSQGTPA